MSFQPLPVLLLALTCTACAPQPAADASPTAPAPAPAAPMRTPITDLSAFQAFIATHPSPEALRARYPGLLVVLPGEISTRELRSDNSRFFAALDADGRVVGGQFQ
jgi:hypothetical protein